jgi:DNA-binding PadR family transcriptional regulator
MILDQLRSGREMFGLEMVKASNGSLKRGTVYVTLNRMTEKRLVTSRQEKEPADPGMPRRLYEITGHGQRVLNAVDAAAAVFYGEVRHA